MIPTPELFSVYIFMVDGQSERVATFIPAEESVMTAKSWTTRPAAALGIIARVIITDCDDSCCFEWKAGQGVTFPPREA